MNAIRQLFETKPNSGVGKPRASDQVRPMRALHPSEELAYKLKKKLNSVA
jgi:hypothetical protein